MAINGTLNTSSYDGRYLQFSWVAAQSIEDNTSVVTWELRAKGGAASWYNTRNIKVLIDGVQWYSATGPIQAWADQLLASGTVTLKHDATTGKRTFAVSVEAGVYTSSVNVRGSETFTLTDIPRATLPEVSGSKITGQQVTITMPRASSAFTHTLTWKFFESEGTIGENLGTSTTWTIPRAFANQIPDAVSGTCTITCTTYNGKTKIGEKSVNFKITLNSADIPTVSGLTVADTNATAAQIFGDYRARLSVIKISFTAAGVYGSTIKTKTAKVTDPTGQTVMVSDAETFSLPVLPSAGTYTVTVTVTDSRGRSSKRIQTVEVLDYHPPQCGYLRAYRSSAAGDPQADGLYITVEFSISIVQAGQNTAQYTLTCTKVGGSEPYTIASGSDFELAKITTTADEMDESGYTVKLSISDAFHPKAFETDVPSTFSLIGISAGGTGIAFGKSADKENFFDCALPAGFKNLNADVLSFAVNDVTGDLNAVLTSGFYYATSTATNRPISGQGFLIVYARPAGTVFQQFIALSGARYQRFYASSSWGAWQSA